MENKQCMPWLYDNCVTKSSSACCKPIRCLAVNWLLTVSWTVVWPNHHLCLLYNRTTEIALHKTRCHNTVAHSIGVRGTSCGNTASGRANRRTTTGPLGGESYVVEDVHAHLQHMHPCEDVLLVATKGQVDWWLCYYFEAVDWGKKTL